ncbi:PhzF family phenazine biosynthesis protein [Alteromonas gilva]|uniref:PhzF family phenazine biosynthesis protein n=1 Tax=Alteromonas gilva TaxID=2987522 RepID=A0ABT5KYT6_9ALTE|nr:PhzF family phenazine biosynthesis protein [Alteromonas gilva]MDC8829798.1 PhzF family phenazine biosynthesis protein [Alteromonas gilva]
MNIQKIAAFSDGEKGGNPAGVVLLDSALDEQTMAAVAAEVGYSETAFAYPLTTAADTWGVRYFSPESEVPFCGHATIALGAVLGKDVGIGQYKLEINDASIGVVAKQHANGIAAELTSPATKSRSVTQQELTSVLTLFALQPDDLDERLAPAWIHGGSNHIVLVLKSRQTLAQMRYDLAAGKALMAELGLVTIMLVVIEHDTLFIARNAFASGGVLEDPATGAAAAAFAGYLRDQHWPHTGSFTIKQGEDMGAPSLIYVALTDEPGSPVSISGSTRALV